MGLIDADELIKCIPSEEYNSRFAIMNAPTVELQKWIPCSERLPKYGQVVLWCNEHGSVFTSEITYRCGDSWAIGKKHRSTKVVAWMPLPDPWNGETK